MKTLLAAGGLLLLAAAGCSSDSSGAPDPGALASSIQAQATSPATESSPADGGSGDCGSAAMSGRAALAGASITDVTMVEDCATILVTTPITDPAVASSLCERVAGEVYQMGVKNIRFESDAGAVLATGTEATGCQAA